MLIEYYRLSAKAVFMLICGVDPADSENIILAILPDYAGRSHKLGY